MFVEQTGIEPAWVGLTGALVTITSAPFQESPGANSGTPSLYPGILYLGTCEVKRACGPLLQDLSCRRGVQHAGGST